MPHLPTHRNYPASPRPTAETGGLAYALGTAEGRDITFRALSEYIKQSLAAVKSSIDVVHDVASGKLDPNSDEALQRALGAAGMMVGGSALVARPRGIRVTWQSKTPDGITVFHGSPHDFDKFSTSQIGRGEGTQTFGHGLYFSESRVVGEAYRDSTSPSNILTSKYEFANPLTGKTTTENSISISTTVANVFDNKAAGAFSDRFVVQHSIDPAASVETLIQRAQSQMKSVLNMNPIPNDLAAEIASRIKLPPGGRLYKARIDADPEDFLDWDKPLSEQNPKIVDALQGAMNERQWAEFQNASAGDAVRRGFIAFTDEGVAKKLSDTGIKGIRYKDAGSRGTEGGTSNYVVFDDANIEILDKLFSGGPGGKPAGALAVQASLRQIDEATETLVQMKQDAGTPFVSQIDDAAAQLRGLREGVDAPGINIENEIRKIVAEIGAAHKSAPPKRPPKGRGRSTVLGRALRDDEEIF